MARKKKRPTLNYCKVSRTTHPKAPWRVSYPVEREGKSVRVRKSFAHEDDAWRFAEEQESEITNHGIRFGELPPEARRAFDYYRDTAAELKERGAAVPRFEILVVDALARVRDQFVGSKENSVTVAEGVESFLSYKVSRVGDRQLADLRTRLKRFAEDFGDRSIRSIATAEIETWLECLRSRKNPDRLAVPPLLAPLSRNHYRATVHGFFAYGTAPARKWSDLNPVADFEPERVETSEPEAYSPKDAAKLMQTALDSMPELVPVLALGLFCGLRVSEAQQIDLEKLPKRANEFRTPPNRKTGPRMAPFTEAAQAWLSAQDRQKGKAWNLSDRERDYAMQNLFTLSGVDKIANGARHSFISYRTAETRDVARVADECGNSVSTIKKYYRQLVTSEEAESFFAIRPESEADNVTKIQEGRVSG